MIKIYEQDWTSIPDAVRVKTLTGKKLVSKNNTKSEILCRITPKTLDDMSKILDSIHWDIDRQHAYLHGKYKAIAQENLLKLHSDATRVMLIMDYIGYIVKKFPHCKSDMYVVKDSVGSIAVLSLDLAADLFDIGGVLNESCSH